MTTPDISPVSPDVILAESSHARIEAAKDWIMHSKMVRYAGGALLAAVGTFGVVEIASASHDVKPAAAAPANGQQNSPNNTPVASGCEAVEKYAVPTTPPSLFGQMFKQEGSGKQIPYSPNKAADQVLGQACEKIVPQAVMATIYGIYEGQVQTSGDLSTSITNNLVKPGSPEAITAEENILNFANILNPTTEQDPFIVDEKTMEIVATATGFDIKPAQLTYGHADGYRIGINNQTNNPDVQKRYQMLGDRILITTNGTVLLNLNISSSSIDVQQLLQESLSNNNPQIAPNGSNPNNSNNAANQQGVTNHGPVNEQLPGQSNEATTGTGLTPNTGPNGTTPNTGPGTTGAPGTTPNTGPGTTTPNTYVTTTTAPYINTTTTTSPNKGPVPTGTPTSTTNPAWGGQ